MPVEQYFDKRVDTQIFRPERCGRIICMGEETYGKRKEAIMAMLWLNTENKLYLAEVRKLQEIDELAREILKAKQRI